MLDLSEEALKILMYLQEDLLKGASKSKFLMSICVRSKGFKVNIQVKQMISSQVSTIIIIIIFIIINLVFAEVEIITVPKKLIKFNFKI